MTYHQELSVVALPQVSGDDCNVVEVKSRVDLIEDKHRLRPVLVDGQDQAQGTEGLFTSGKHLHLLPTLTLRSDS